MILDVPRFVKRETPYWEELEKLLHRLDADRYASLSLPEVARLHYLYDRAGAALSKMAPLLDTQADYLENLVARAYAELHPAPATTEKWHVWKWFTQTFPQTFRRRWPAFALTVALTLAGSAFGSLAITFDPDSKSVLMPFSNLMESPAERVHEEEHERSNPITGHSTSFSTELMTHNIQVALTVFALGATAGVGSAVLLFYNGIMLGAVVADYTKAGFGTFVAGWLLPHGVIEIPAILVAGQAAFVLAAALIGYGNEQSLRARLRSVSKDILTLAGGAAVLLIWAGIVEAFISQYHYPVLPYEVKIIFGLVEFAVLLTFLLRAGANQQQWNPNTGTRITTT